MSADKTTLPYLRAVRKRLAEIASGGYAKRGEFQELRQAEQTLMRIEPLWEMRLSIAKDEKSA